MIGEGPTRAQSPDGWPGSPPDAAAIVAHATEPSSWWAAGNRSDSSRQDVVLEQVDKPHHVAGFATREQLFEGAVVEFEPRHVVGIDPFGDEGREHTVLLSAGVRCEHARQLGDELRRGIARLVRTTESRGQGEQTFVIGRQGSDLGFGAAAAVVTHVVVVRPPSHIERSGRIGRNGPSGASCGAIGTSVLNQWARPRHRVT